MDRSKNQFVFKILFYFKEGREYEEDNDNHETSVNNVESSNISPIDDKQLNGQEKEGMCSVLNLNKLN